MRQKQSQSQIDTEMLKKAESVLKESHVFNRSQLETVATLFQQYKGDKQTIDVLSENLSKIGSDLKSKEAVVAIADALSKYKNKPEIVKALVKKFQFVVQYTISPKKFGKISTVKRIAREISDPVVVKHLSSFDTLTATTISGWIPAVAYYKRDLKKTLGMLIEPQIAQALSLFDSSPEIKAGVADSLFWNAIWEKKVPGDKKRKLFKVISNPNFVESMLKLGKTPKVARGVSVKLVDEILGKRKIDEVRLSKLVRILTNPSSSTWLSELNTRNSINTDLPKFMDNLLSSNEKDLEKFMQNKGRMVKVLKEKFGIEFFGRYPLEILNQQYESSISGQELSQKPLALLFFSQYDDNGVFYDSKKLIRKMSKHYNVKIFEAGTDTDFINRIEQFKKRYGKSTVALLVLSGHGQADSIKLGDSYLPEAQLDVTDKAVFKSIAGVMKKGGDLIFNSCRVEKKLVGVISKSIGNIRVHGSPRKIAYVSVNYTTDRLGNPSIANVTYASRVMFIRHKMKVYSEGEKL